MQARLNDPLTIMLANGAMLRALFLCVCLAACSSGGGSPDPEPEVTYSDYYDSVLDLQVTPLSQVPDGGSYNYSGQMALNLPLDAAKQEYIGAFDLSLDVGTSTVDATGRVSNFTDQGGDTLGGALAFSGGIMNPGADPDRDFLMYADLDGALTKDGTTFDLTAKLRADFYGPDIDAVAGVVYGGRIEHDKATGGFTERVVDVFDGTFAGQAMP